MVETINECGVLEVWNIKDIGPQTLAFLKEFYPIHVNKGGAIAGKHIFLIKGIIVDFMSWHFILDLQLNERRKTHKKIIYFHCDYNKVQEIWESISNETDSTSGTKFEDWLDLKAYVTIHHSESSSTLNFSKN